MLSTRLLFGLPLLAVFAGCAQPDVVPTSPTSAGSSATAVGPSAGYDATGRWHFVTTVDGVVDEDFETDVTQHSNGNLSFLNDEDELVTLERLSQGTGAIITYRVFSIGSEGGDCDLRVKGTVRLDTTTNTITATARLKELGCSNTRLGVFVTGTKLP